MQTSDKMIEVIKAFEGCRLDVYRDAVGVWTIGYGHTGPDVHAGIGRITQAQADHLLRQDLEKFEKHVMNQLPSTTQHQFDALVSFTYNVGQGALSSSTLRKKHNAGDHAGAASEFGRWNKAGGKVLSGLTRRRAAEAAVYSNANYSTV